tara:strand:+ start:13205 stop:17128 length:3924 start_codon:yes stop_codon:yes gene_type:complete
VSKKDIIIEVLQGDGGVETQTTTTVTNTVTNPTLIPTLAEPNVFANSTAFNDPLPQNAAVLANTASDAYWNAWSQGTGGTIADVTPAPARSGTTSGGNGIITFSGNSSAASEEVTNWDFSTNSFAGSYSNNSSGALNGAMTAFFNTGTTGVGLGWYRWRTTCSGGVKEVDYPSVTTAGGSSGGFIKLYKAIDTCSGGATSGDSGIIQVLNLTAGTQYKIKIKLKTAAPTPGGWIYFGWCKGVYCQTNTLGGNTFNSLGFNWPTNIGTPLYGTWASGGGPGNCACGGNLGSGVFVKADTTAEQSVVFTSVGGNEVLVLKYLDMVSSNQNIEIDYISIKEDTVSGISLSGMYQKLVSIDPTKTYDLSITVESAPTGLLGAEIIVGWLDAPYPDNDAYAGQFTNPTQSSQIWVWADNANGNAGLPTSFPATLTTQITSSNDSSGAFAAGDRFLGISVLSQTEDNVTISEIKYEFSTTNTVTGIDQDLNTYGKLEVSNSQDFPLNISYTISDGKNLESRFGDYSQSFDIPASKMNNKTLNRIWNPVINDTQRSYGIKPCRVLVDGTPFFNGNLQIKKSTQTGKPKSYSCTIYGGNFSWMTLLKDLELCTVFGDTETFFYDLQEIEDTWPLTHTSTNVQYPLISYGDFNENGAQGVVNTYDVDETPDWRPSFYVYNMFMKIFNNIGYKISSQYLESPQFKTLLNHFPFLDNQSSDKKDLFSFEVRLKDVQDYTGTGNTQLYNAYVGGSIQFFNGAVAVGLWNALGALPFETIRFDDVINDNANQYTVSNGQFVAKQDGVFEFHASGGYQLQNYTTNCFGGGGVPNCGWEWNGINKLDIWYWKTRIKVTPISGASVYYINGNPGMTGAYNLNPTLCTDESRPLGTEQVSGSATLFTGDIVEVQMAFNGQGGLGCEPDVYACTMFDSNYGAPGQPYFKATYETSVPSLGDTLEVNRILPCGVTQIDYIKSIAHLFNLYFTTDVISKTIYIEPFNDFFKPTSEGVNWESKIDYSQQINDVYDVGLKRELKIGYKNDSADGYQKTKNLEAGNYGEDTKLFDYYENLGQDYIPGTLEMINPIFAATTQVHDSDAVVMQGNCIYPVLIPNIWSEDAFSGLTLGPDQWRPPKIWKYEPRILYYHWENPDDQGGSGVTQLQTRWTWIDASGVMHNCATVYPRAVFTDLEEFQHSITKRLSLSFDDERYIPPNISFNGTAVERSGLYTTYYKNMIEQLKQAPRIREVFVDLKMKDILNLDMRQLVYFQESWWRVNRIVEYSPANNQPTKVELIQWLEVGFADVWNGYTGTALNSGPVSVGG